MITANEARELTVQDVDSEIYYIEGKIKAAALEGKTSVEVDVRSFYGNKRKLKAVKLILQANGYTVKEDVASCLREDWENLIISWE